MCSAMPRRMAVIGSMASPGRRRGPRAQAELGLQVRPVAVQRAPPAQGRPEQEAREEAPRQPVEEPARLVQAVAEQAPPEVARPEAARVAPAPVEAGRVAAAPAEAVAPVAVLPEAAPPGPVPPGRCRLSLATGLDEREDVLLRHAAARPGARHRGRIDAVLGCDPGDDRRDEALSVPGGRRRSGGGGAGVAGAGSGGCSRRLRSGASRALRRRRCPSWTRLRRGRCGRRGLGRQALRAPSRPGRSSRARCRRRPSDPR